MYAEGLRPYYSGVKRSCLTCISNSVQRNRSWPHKPSPVGIAAFTGRVWTLPCFRCYSARFKFPIEMMVEPLAYIKRPRSGPGPASLSGWECVHKSGGGGAEFLDCDLLFGAEPIFLFVTVLAAAGLVEFIGSALGSAARVRCLVDRLLRSLVVSSGDCHSWGRLLEANVRPVEEWSQLPKIGAVKSVNCAVRP